MTDPVPGPTVAGAPNWTRIARRLARVGFADPEDAARRLTGPGLALWDGMENAPVDDRAAAVVSALGRVADPDQALSHLDELVATSAGSEVRAALLDSASLRQRLLGLLGLSGPSPVISSSARSTGSCWWASTTWWRPAGGWPRPWELTRTPRSPAPRAGGPRAPSRRRSWRCARPTRANWPRWPGATWPAPSPSSGSPRRSRTWPTGCCGPPWPWPRPGCPRTPHPAGSPSSRWARPVDASSTTSRTST